MIGIQLLTARRCQVMMAIIAVGWTTSCFAVDVVTQISNGRTIQGRVTDVNRNGVTIKPGVGPEVTVPANDINAVRWDGAPLKLQLAINDELNGRLDKALEGYRAAREESSANDRLEEELEYLESRTLAKKALQSAGQPTEAASRLEAFLQSNSDTYHYFESMELLSRLYLAAGDNGKAREMLQAMSQAPWNDVTMAARNGEAQIALAEQNPNAALAAYDAVIDMTAENESEQSERFAAILGKAAVLLNQQRQQEALQSIEMVIDQTTPEQTEVLALAYVRQGDCLQQMGRPKDAVLAYLHVDVLPTLSVHQNYHAESLYHLSQLWRSVGNSDRALEAREKLVARYPGSPWSQKLGGGSQ